MAIQTLDMKEIRDNNVNVYEMSEKLAELIRDVIENYDTY